MDWVVELWKNLSFPILDLSSIEQYTINTMYRWAITHYIKKFALMNNVNPLLNQNYTCKMKWLLLSAQKMVKSSN
ncbi:hypothetical protein BT93_J1818 [Corymbia citriodora subsp. variegata]|nr:hypothetical protein BT93_J1818 [Corymbia citriodora subsp. variegata]